MSETIIFLLIGFMLLVWMILYLINTQNRVQKFNWLKSGLTIGSILLVTFSLYFIYFIISQINETDGILFLLTMILLAIVLCVVLVYSASIYFDLLCIREAINKHVEKIRNGHYEIAVNGTTYEVVQEEVQKVVEYNSPYTGGRSPFTFSILHIYLKSGVLLNINSFVCDSGFLDSVFKDVTIESKYWRFRSAYLLITKKDAAT